MKKRIDFSKYSSIKIGPTVDVYLISKETPIPNDATIIGSCSNILVGNNPPPLMMLSKEFDFIKINHDTITIGAATPSGKLFSFSKRHNIGGFEFLAHLPGKLGGLVKMNAGLKEFEIFDNLLSITTSKGVFSKEQITYGYRYANIEGVIFDATFKVKKGFDAKKVALFHDMRRNQPKEPSAGSFFKNPVNDYAGRLIEAVGLKGYRIGEAAWSNKHANFLVNLGSATFEDAITLVKLVKKRVYEEFGIELQEEVIVLDTAFNHPKG